MSGFFQTDVQNALLDNAWGNQDGTWPVTWYVALFTTMPDADGNGGVEAAWTDYDRVAVTNDLTEWPAAIAGAKSNANELDYGVAGSGPQSVVGFGFYDDPSSVLAANFYAGVTVTGGSVVVNNGATVKFPAEAIDLSGCV